MTEPRRVTIKATIDSVRIDRDKNTKMTLNIPASDAVNAAVLGIAEEVVFDISFTESP